MAGSHVERTGKKQQQNQGATPNTKADAGEMAVLAFTSHLLCRGSYGVG